jgi:hypothetical protein
MQKFAAGKFHHLYARGQRVARERAEVIDEGRCPPTAWALPLEKGLRHVPVGSSAIKLPQSRGDAKGRNIAFWQQMRGAAMSALLPLLGGERTYRGHLKNDVRTISDTGPN